MCSRPSTLKTKLRENITDEKYNDPDCTVGVLGNVLMLALEPKKQLIFKAA